MVVTFMPFSNITIYLKVAVLLMLFSCRISICRNQSYRCRRGCLSMKLSSRSVDSSSKLSKNVWLSPVGTLKGVGAKTEEVLLQLEINTIADVLFHFPTGIIDRRKRSVLSTVKLGDVITIELNVRRTERGLNGRPHSASCEDSEGQQVAVLFYYSSPFAYNSWADFKQESSVLVSGKISANKFSGAFEMINPDIVMSTKEPSELLNRKFCIEPVYGLTKGLKNTKIRTIIESSLQAIRDTKVKGDDVLQEKSDTPMGQFSNIDVEDWMILDERKKRNWPTLVEALHALHNPTCEEEILPNSIPRQRLAFDDFVSQFLHQMAKQSQVDSENESKSRDKKNQKVRDSSNGNSALDRGEKMAGYSIVGSGMYSDRFVSILPFNLTKCQKNAVMEISQELAVDKKMSRLLQGDVGSGKTLVAVLAVLGVMECEMQGAIVAPTALLASQHHKVITDYFEKISNSFPHLCITPEHSQHDKNFEDIMMSYGMDKGNEKPSRRLRVELLTSNVKGKERERLLMDVQNGFVDLLIGTHALLNEDIIDRFPSLGLVIIDEEQRFGVEQRDVIASRTNTIYMTATPIPRSLYVLSENENTISTLIEKPPLRRKVTTITRPYGALKNIVERIKFHSEFGTKVFWVCPTLQPSDTSPKGSSVLERYEMLSMAFPGQVGILHGRMSSEEKEATMELFSQIDSTMSILVSTTVIEVGVDVPDSSICIIDRAEAFGLSQLHQIRGRVGRGEKPPREILDKCFCVLLYDDTIDGTGNHEAHVSVPTTAIRRPIPMKLEILEKTNDGFEIAEKDLEMRGPGDMFGSVQSGLRFTGLRAADFMQHTNLLKDAHAMATAIHTNKYPYLVGDREIQDLLTLFRAPSSTPTLPPRSLSSPVSSKTSESISKIAKSESPHHVADLTITEGPCAPVVILFDLETTGLSATQHRIIQFAAKVLETGNHADENLAIPGRSRNRQFNEYVKPEGVKMSREITRLTGISQEDLDTKGKSFSNAWLGFLDWLKEVSESDVIASENEEVTRRPIVLVAHNLINFDLPFLDLEIRRNDLDTHGDWILSANISSFVDSLRLLRLDDLWSERKRDLNLPPAAASQPERKKLGSVYEFIHGREIVNAHNASSDIDALGEILESHGMKDIWRKHALKLQTLSFKRYDL